MIDYKALFDDLPESFIGFHTDDPAFTIAFENQAHKDIAMVGKKTVVGKPLLEIFPDTSEKFLKTGDSDLLDSLRRVIRTAKPDTMEILHYDLPRPDGSMETRYWQVTHYPLLDDQGAVSLVYQATKDITGEIVVGNQLQTAQNQLDDALGFSMIGTFSWDIAENKVIGDANMAVMFGLTTAEAAAGLPLTAFTSAIHQDDVERVEQEIGKAVDNGTPYYSEYRTLSADGSLHWLIARGRAVRDETGNPTNFSGVLVDITERKTVENNMTFLARASSVLSASLDYRKTLQTITELMVPDIADWCTVDILDDDNTLQLVALAHRDPTKIAWARKLRARQGSPDIKSGNGVAEVIRTGKAVFYPNISKAAVLASGASDKELALLEKLAISSVIIVPLRIHDKTVGAITLIAADQKRMYTKSDLEMANELASRASLAMTNASLFDKTRAELLERRRLEEALRIANEELEQRVADRTAELGDINVSLERSNQELQDFAYVASHDLQEPLRKIQAFGNLLESEYSSELGEGGDYLRRMRSAAARMSALIEDILSFSRVTTKGRSFVDVDLDTIAHEVVSDLEIRIADTKATVHIQPLPTIHADPMQMRQLLQNLIANAIKFHRDGVAPIITISAITEDLPNVSFAAGSEIIATGHTQKSSTIRYCRLEVADNGLGFEEKYLDRIFAVFQRLHSRDNYEGTGIGLAVCRKIVERHGGSITAKSQPGKGTTFIVRLPIRHKKGENLL